MPIDLLAMISSLFSVGVVGGGLYLALRFVRATERKAISEQEIAELRERLAQLENRLESVGKDVERLTDEQEFTIRLLSDRSGQSNRQG